MVASAQSPLARLLEPVAQCLTPEVARQVVALKPDPGTQARIDELAAKANEGLLTPEEHDEYHAYVEAIDVISLLQAKARKLAVSREP